MASIIPVSSIRTSNQLVQQRLLVQLQGDQFALLRLQRQLSTGRAFDLPSENPAAAQRGLSLQRLLEQKSQYKSNLQSSQSYLNATDNVGSAAADLLASAHSLALSSAAGTAGDRQAAVHQLDQIIDQLITAGNQQFRGRNLLAGSDPTIIPYAKANGAVLYRGDESAIRTFTDISTLTNTNVTGQQLLGGLSAEVRGASDLNPRVTAQTRLVDLHGGAGISPGSIAVSDGSSVSVVDISSAETVGDVASLIERQPPAGRHVRATVTAAGINVELLEEAPPVGGNLNIREVGGGTTAQELGLFNATGVGVGTIVGGNLDPRLTGTTSLKDILGVRASGYVRFSGAQNDIFVEAVNRGAAFNNVTVELVDGGTAALGNETAVYDVSNPLDKRLRVTIANGNSTANSVVAAINATGVFSARLDAGEAQNDGSGTVLTTASSAASTVVTAGGSGIEFDQTAGLRIASNGQTHVVDLSVAQNVEDLLNAINRSPVGAVATLNAAGNGIDVRSRISGADFSIGENGGSTATELGLRTLTGSTTLADLNHGLGVGTRAGGDFRIRRKDGAILNISLTGATTINDVINRINTDAANVNDAWRVTARLARVGNGIELQTTSSAGTATFAVLSQGSPAPFDLGLIPVDRTQSLPGAVQGGVESISGADVHPYEGQGAFHALVRLRDAIQSNNAREIERSAGLLDQASTQLSYARAQLGAQQQTVEALLSRLDTEDVDLRSALSSDVEADFTKVISEFTQREAAYQASLQLLGRTAKLSLLDFL